MKCRSCGTTIADKAIVCFRCGAPAGELPQPVLRPAASRPFGRLLLIAVVITALGAWLIPQTPEGTWMRWTAWAAVPFVTYAAVRLIRGPRSR